MPITSDPKQMPVDPLAQRELTERLNDLSHELYQQRSDDIDYYVRGAMFYGVQSPPDTRVNIEGHMGLSANRISFGGQGVAIASMHPTQTQLASHFRMLLEQGTVLVNLASTDTGMSDENGVNIKNDMDAYGDKGAHAYISANQYQGIQVEVSEAVTHTLAHPDPGPGRRPLQILEYTVTIRDGDLTRALPALQITNWPDKAAIPAAQLDALVTLIRERHQQALQTYLADRPLHAGARPVPVVHCIGGAGRTGMVIAGMQLSAEGNPFSLEHIVSQIREQRSHNSVQTDSQLDTLVDYAQKRGVALMNDWGGKNTLSRIDTLSADLDQQLERIQNYRDYVKQEMSDASPSAVTAWNKQDAALTTLENQLIEASGRLNDLTGDPHFVALTEAQKIQRTQAQLANLFLPSAEDLQRHTHAAEVLPSDRWRADSYQELLDEQKHLYAQRQYLVPPSDAGAPLSPLQLDPGLGARTDKIKVFSASLKQVLERVQDYTAALMNKPGIYEDFTASKSAVALFDIERYLTPVAARLEEATAISPDDRRLIDHYLPSAHQIRELTEEIPFGEKIDFERVLADLQTLHTHYQGLTQASAEPSPSSSSSGSPLQIDTTLERRLSQKGNFILHRRSSGELELFHRSSSGRIQRTPVLRDEVGGLTVNNPNWATRNLGAYTTVNQLRQALIDKVHLSDVSIAQDLGPAPLSDYAISPRHADSILNPANRLLSPSGRLQEHFSRDEILASSAKRSAERQLIDDARAYDFAQASARTQPEPPTLNTLDPAPFVRIAALLQAAPGMVMGADRGSAWANRLITDYAAFWHEQGVRTLFLDILPAEYQGELRQFNAKGTMSRRLADFVATLDRGAQKHHYSYRALLESAQKSGIEVVAASCMASRAPLEWTDGSSENQADRARAAKYYTSRTIEQHQQTQPAGRKWLALTSTELSQGTGDIPGLKQLTGALGVQVQTDETGHAPLTLASKATSGASRSIEFVLKTPANEDAVKHIESWTKKYHRGQSILTHVVLLRQAVDNYIAQHTGLFKGGRAPTLEAFNSHLQDIETTLRATRDAAPEVLSATLERITQGDLKLMSVIELKQKASVLFKKAGPSYQAIQEGLEALHQQLASPLPPLDPDPLLSSPFATQQRVLAWAEVHEQFMPKFRTLGSELGGAQGEGIVRMAPQTLYRSYQPENNADGTPRGQCDALTRALLLDDSSNRRAVLNNLYQAMANPDDAPSQQFRQAIERLNTPRSARQMSSWLPEVTRLNQVVDYLTRHTGETRVAVHLGQHTVGFRAWDEGGARRYALYDANLGVWAGLSDPAAFKQNLAQLYDATLLQRYGALPDDKLKAFNVHEPPALEDLADLRKALRVATDPLESTHERLARLDHADGGVKVGHYSFTRQELYASRHDLNPLGVTVGGRAIGPDTDWTHTVDLPARVKLPENLLKPRAGALQTVGTGMRIYGTYRALQGSMEQLGRGDPVEAGMSAAGAGGMWLSEGVERGALSLGAFLQRTYAHTLSLGASMARRLGASMARGAGLISQVLTIPFDIYEMHGGFSQFGRAKDPLLRQDGLFRGLMATTSLVVGLGIAVAAAAGASASVLGPLGLAFAGVMMAGSQIYTTARQVQEVKKWVSLSASQEMALAASFYFEGGINRETEERMLRAQFDPLVQQRAEERALRLINGEKAAYRAVVYAKPKTVSRILGTESRSDHAHQHVVQKAESAVKRNHTEYLPAYNVGVRHETPLPSDNYEIYILPTSSEINLVRGLPASDENWEVKQGALSDLPVLIQAGNSQDDGKVLGMTDRPTHVQLGSGNWVFVGGEKNDVITLDAHPDDLAGYETDCQNANRLHTYSYYFDGAGGNDTLQIATSFAHSNASGYRINLKTQTLELLSRTAGDQFSARSIGTVRRIENLSQTPSSNPAPTYHEFIGNDQDNIIKIGGHGRALGMGGNDLLYVFGSGFVDGGTGQDRYFVQMLNPEDRPTIQDSQAGSQATPVANPVYLDMSIQLIRDWKIVGLDLMIGFKNGAELTINNVYRQESQGRVLTPWTRWEFITQDGFALQPQLPEKLANNKECKDFTLSSQYIKLADRAYAATQQGIFLDMATRSISATSASRTPIPVVQPNGQRWGVVSPGSTADGTLYHTLVDEGAGLVINHDARDIQLKLRYRVESSRDDAGKLKKDLRVHGIEFIVTFAATELRYRGLTWLDSALMRPTATPGLYTLNFDPARQPLLMTRDGYRLDWLANTHTIHMPTADLDALTSGAVVRSNILVDFPLNFVGAAETHWQVQNVLQLDARYQLLGQGTPYGDILQGTMGRDVFRPMAGEDQVHTRGGNDIIIVDAAPETLKIHTDRPSDAPSASASPDSTTLMLVSGSVADVGFEIAGEDLLLRAVMTDPTQPGASITRPIRHRFGASEQSGIAPLSIIDQQGIALYWDLIPIAKRIVGYTQVANDQTGSTLSARAGGYNILQGKSRADILNAGRHEATLMQGQDGTDRYQVEILGARPKDKAAIFLNNWASDGELDTLEVKTDLAPGDFIWQRNGDDLCLAVGAQGTNTQPQPSVVLMGYYQSSSRRHLEVRFINTAGTVLSRIGADQLENLSLNPQKTRGWQENINAQAQALLPVQRLIEELARFDPAGGVASAPTMLGTTPPAKLLLAPAA